jgi:hypothetical protein
MTAIKTPQESYGPDAESQIHNRPPEAQAKPLKLQEIAEERGKRIMQVVRQLSLSRSVDEVEALFYVYLGVAEPITGNETKEEMEEKMWGRPEYPVTNMSIQTDKEKRTITIHFPACEEKYVSDCFLHFIGGTEISRTIIDY